MDSGGEAIDRVSVAAGKTEQVATLGGDLRVVDETYGAWAGLGPDDSPVILRRAGLRQIYLLSFKGR
jgi:hypothetical protein